MIRKMFDCSTGHLSVSAKTWLDGSPKEIDIISYPEGFIIYTKFQDEDYHPALLHLVQIARTMECDFIQLDADGTIYDWIIIHDWH